MAGHSKFKNIQHRKNAQDKKRAKIFTRVLREISTALKSDSKDPETNPRLRSALLLAKSANLPKDKIDKAMQASSSENDYSKYTEMRYEGFMPGGIGLIVEALTDNKNRTASEVRSIFSKFGGNLGEMGSVSFMFEKLGVIEYDENIAKSFDEIMEIGLESNAKDVELLDGSYLIYTAIEDFHEVLNKVSDKLGNPANYELRWIPNTKVTLSDKERAEKLCKMLNALEDSDDVQDVYGNYELSEDLKYLIEDDS